MAESRLNRRRFLQLAAGTATALGCPHWSAASEHVPLTKPITGTGEPSKLVKFGK